MIKQGILHDYDVHANYESSAKGQTCAVCGAFPTTFQWSDYSGEAMCTKCGCSYQLKWGSDKQKEEGKYPYLSLTSDFIPVAKEYWEARMQFVCYGLMLGPEPGMSMLVAWLKEHHPEHIKEEDAS